MVHGMLFCGNIRYVQPEQLRAIGSLIVSGTTTACTQAQTLVKANVGQSRTRLKRLVITYRIPETHYGNNSYPSAIVLQLGPTKRLNHEVKPDEILRHFDESDKM